MGRVRELLKKQAAAVPWDIRQMRCHAAGTIVLKSMKSRGYRRDVREPWPVWHMTCFVKGVQRI